MIEVEGISYSYVGKDPVIDRAIVNAWKKGCTAMKFGSYGLMGIPVLIIMVIFTDMTWSFAIVFWVIWELACWFWYGVGAYQYHSAALPKSHRSEFISQVDGAQVGFEYKLAVRRNTDPREIRQSILRE